MRKLYMVIIFVFLLIFLTSCGEYKEYSNINNSNTKFEYLNDGVLQYDSSKNILFIMGNNYSSVPNSLIAYNFSNKKIIWKKIIDSYGQQKSMPFLLKDNLIYFFNDDPEVRGLYSADKETGKIINYLPIKEKVSLHDFSVSDNNLYILTEETQNIYKINLDTFNIIWKKTCSDMITTPILNSTSNTLFGIKKKYMPENQVNYSIVCFDNRNGEIIKEENIVQSLSTNIDSVSIDSEENGIIVSYRFYVNSKYNLIVKKWKILQSVINLEWEKNFDVNYGDYSSLKGKKVIIYESDFGKGIQAINKNDGQPLWKKKLNTLEQFYIKNDILYVFEYNKISLYNPFTGSLIKSINKKYDAVYRDSFDFIDNTLVYIYNSELKIY